MNTLKPRQFIPHGKYMPQSMIDQYGDYATHHIRVPILLAYDGQEKPIYGKEGVIKKLDKTFIDQMLKDTNKSIDLKHKNIFSKTISRLKGNIEDALVIPIIKDHDTDSVDGVVGHSIGLLYTAVVHDRYGLYVDALIQDIDAKMKVELGIWQPTSFGSLGYDIKEISFVVREAIPNCGTMMGENIENIESLSSEVIDPVYTKDPELDKMSELNQLKMAEARLENILIPNTKIARRMVQNGQILPFKAKELIESSTPEILLMMEKCMPVHKLNIISGIGKDPSELQTSPVRSEQVLKMSEISKYAKKSSKEMAKKTNTQIKENVNDLEHTKQILQQEMIDYNYQTKSEKTQILEDILQMCEQNPEYIKDYVEFELGINKNQVDNEHNSPSLQSALAVLEGIRKQKKILMGEKNEL